jgi:deferrochelatase/peroxidase EfeB
MAGRVPIRERGPGESYRPDSAPPTVFGLHQPGIATPAMERLAVAAFDLDGLDPAPRLRQWTAVAEEVMRDGAGTVTIGLGAAATPSRGPVALAPLPAFEGDALDPALCGGDLCVFAAPEVIGRFGTPRWLQVGRRGDTLGFRDGTLIPRRGKELDRHVWVGRGDRSGMTGGTYVVMRRIVVDRARWDALPTSEQERIIGRDKRTGAPLGGRALYEKPDLTRLAPDAHIRVASPRENDGATILRRGYVTEDGLLFLAFMRDPRRQYVPLQRKLAEHDALSAYTRHVASAVFAIPPGARRAGFVGDRLLGY